MITLYHSRSSHAICLGNQCFNAWRMGWEEAPVALSEGEPVTPREALTIINAHHRVRQIPVAVIGPREATDEQRTIAEALGRALHEAGFLLLCGGMTGVMEAVCAGHAGAGGRPMAFLPGEDWHEANDHVAVPLSTGIRQARNQLIARASFALIAVGGGYGTLSEMAYGLHFGKLVLAMADAPKVDGAAVCNTVGEAVDKVVLRYFGLD